MRVLMGTIRVSFQCTDVSTSHVRQWRMHNIFKVHDVELQLGNQTAVAKTCPELHNSVMTGQIRNCDFAAPERTLISEAHCR